MKKTTISKIIISPNELKSIIVEKLGLTKDQKFSITFNIGYEHVDDYDERYCDSHPIVEGVEVIITEDK